METRLIEKGLIVSCQAYPGEALYGADVMVRMAAAAKEGGAIAIRTNGPDDVAAIKKTVGLPVIGLLKRSIPGSDIYITPELTDVKAILEAGADIVALDVTDREDRLARAKPLLDSIHQAGALAMADISTFEEGMEADRMGFDYISTTLSGYTPYSPQIEEPDFALIRRLSAEASVPVIAEGRIWNPEDAEMAVACGASFVVVGSAITRPWLVAERFANRIAKQQDNRR